MSDPIIAEAADGSSHEFPAETNPAVVDRVMKQYAMQGKIRSRMSGLPDALKSKTAANIASEGMGALDPILGANSLLDKGVYGLGQLVTSAGGLYPNKVSNWMGEAAHSGEKVSDSLSANLQGLRAESGQSGFDPFRLAGNIASPVNAAFPAPTSLLDATATGSAFGAVQPTSEGQSSLQPVANAAMGAGGGMAGYGLSKMLTGSGGSPSARQKAVALLRGEGVEPPIGAAMGEGPHMIEQKMESTPFIGGGIRASETRANSELNKAVYNRVLDEIGQKMPAGIEPGREAIDHVNKAVSGAYDTALGSALVPKTGALDADIQTVLGNASTMLPERQAQLGAWAKKIEDNFAQNNGVLDGDRLKGLSSDIRKGAMNLMHSGDSEARELGFAVDQLNDVLLKSAKGSNPTLGPQLDAADSAYKNLVRLNRAAGYNGAAGTGGVFTPSQLVSAVGAEARGKASKASGKAVMQDLSDAAAMVLKPTLPNSGTANRELATLAGLGLAGQPHLIPAAGAGWGMARLLNSRPSTAAINSLSTGGASKALAKVAPAAGIAGRIPPALLAQLLQSGAGAPAYGQAP